MTYNLFINIYSTLFILIKVFLDTAFSDNSSNATVDYLRENYKN